MLWVKTKIKTRKRHNLQLHHRLLCWISRLCIIFYIRFIFNCVIPRILSFVAESCLCLHCKSRKLLLDSVSNMCWSSFLVNCLLNFAVFLFFHNIIFEHLVELVGHFIDYWLNNTWSTFCICITIFQPYNAIIRHMLKSNCYTALYHFIVHRT
jgi:hypothetical protein